MSDDLNRIANALERIADFYEKGLHVDIDHAHIDDIGCLLYTSPSPRDATLSRMPSSA